MTTPTASKWMLGEELEKTKLAIKANPSDSSLRVTYFQLLCVTADWAKAGDQLELVESLAPASALFAQAYYRAIQCELERKEVFDGAQSPVVFGEPEQWLAGMIDALRLGRSRNWDAASTAQSAAFEAAPVSLGIMNGVPFDWIADGDSRLGPILEAFIEGKYRWVPFNRIAKIEIAAPRHVVDTIWATANITWTNHGVVKALIPVRYPGIERCSGESFLRGTATEWDEKTRGYYLGTGQRILTSSAEEFGILDVREIVFGAKNGA